MSLHRRAFGVFFAAAGILHFVRPKPFEAIVPDYLPAHRELVQLSGAVELVAGVATLLPRHRGWGRWLSIATLIGVFPSNVHMAVHPERYPQVPGGRPVLIARLPLQALLVLWAYRAGE